MTGAYAFSSLTEHMLLDWAWLESVMFLAMPPSCGRKPLVFPLFPPQIKQAAHFVCHFIPFPAIFHNILPVRHFLPLNAFFSLPRIFKPSSLNHFVSLPPSPHLFSSVTYMHFQELCVRAETVPCVQPNSCVCISGVLLSPFSLNRRSPPSGQACLQSLSN